jgi:hypothetical protein
MPVTKTTSLSFTGSEFRAGAKCVTAPSEHPVPTLPRERGRVGTGASLSLALDLSQSRAHDAALDILGAYKLTGNFHVNLEMVLKDIGVFDKVTYEIESNPKLSYRRDCRHVVFKPNGNISSEMFEEIIKSIEARIGFDEPWWVGLFPWHKRIDASAKLNGAVTGRV